MASRELLIISTCPAYCGSNIADQLVMGSLTIAVL